MAEHLISQAAFDVLAERHRQVAKDFTPEHDDSYVHGELLDAAVSYAERRCEEQTSGTFDPTPPPGWPWVPTWWKPTDRRRDLVKAAALLIAEIERLDRYAAR